MSRLAISQSVSHEFAVGRTRHSSILSLPPTISRTTRILLAAPRVSSRHPDELVAATAPDPTVRTAGRAAGTGGQGQTHQDRTDQSLGSLNPEPTRDLVLDPPKTTPAGPPGNPPETPENKTAPESGPMKPAKIYIV